jgi:AcrR family transcriptional regulator
VGAAIELFGTNGFAETSVRNLSAEVGTKAPASYHHFKSKEEIFAETILVPLSDFNATVLADDDQSRPC